MSNKPKMEERICLYCEKVYSGRCSDLKKGRGKYCSHVCSSAASRKTIIISCSYCGANCERKLCRIKKSKSQIFFCSNKCKYDAASDPEHSFTTGPKALFGLAYRARAFRTYPIKCVRCGYDEHQQLLDVDHIDSNRKNNSVSNLQILCVMCHAIKTRLPELF